MLLDISKQVEQEGPSRDLKAEDLVNWEKENGPIPDNSVLLIKYGWSKYYPDKNLYLGYNNTDKMHFPGNYSTQNNIL